MNISMFLPINSLTGTITHVPVSREPRALHRTQLCDRYTQERAAGA